MAVNKIILERDGLIVGDTQLVASGGGVTIGQNLAIAGNNYVQNSQVVGGNLTVNSNLTVAINTTTGGNLVVGASGRFSGYFDESIAVRSLFTGVAGSGTPTPRVGFFNGTAAQNWQIDNASGTFRWFTPGIVRMSLDTNGNLSIPSTSQSTSSSTGALVVTGGAGVGGNLFVAGRVNSGFTNAAATSGTITINSDLYNQYQVVVNGTAAFAAPSGTPQDGQRLTIRIKDSGSRQTISFTTGSAGAFRGVGLSLPTVSTAAVLYLGCVWNAHDSRWDAIALASA